MTFWKLLKSTSPICFCQRLFSAWEVSTILQVFPPFQKDKLSMLLGQKSIEAFKTIYALFNMFFRPSVADLHVLLIPNVHPSS
jgi:hypothetical protein